MNTLVLGAVGHAVTANQIALKLPVTILARSQAKALFSNEPTLTIIEGDVQDAALVNRLAANRNFIFHGINYPYNKWFGNLDSVAILMSSKSLICWRCWP